jgi:hypothetical protein
MAAAFYSVQNICKIVVRETPDVARTQVIYSNYNVTREMLYDSGKGQPKRAIALRSERR